MLYTLRITRSLCYPYSRILSFLNVQFSASGSLKGGSRKTVLACILTH